MRDERVASVAGSRGAFRVALGSELVEARRVLLCTGMIDEMLPIDSAIADELRALVDHDEPVTRVTPESGSVRLRRYLQTANAGWGYTTKHYALTCQRSR